MSRRSLVLLAALAACTRPAAEPPAEPAPAATFVGAEMCIACHDEPAASMAKTIHGRAIFDESRPEAERGCEACHGAGSIHAEAGGTEKGGMHQFKDDESARSRAQPCFACHGTSRLHDFLSGGHAMAQVACSDCHRVHVPKSQPLLAGTPPELCYGCHADVRALFALTEHHKVPERVVGCLDCHEPHGSRHRAALKDDEDRLCTTCHTEVQGPFVFEHAGLLTEGCTGCHEPHGSVNRHLLVRQQVAQLCLECHTSTPQNHTQPSFRDCTRCHTAIHGSNTDPHFLAP